MPGASMVCSGGSVEEYCSEGCSAVVWSFDTPCSLSSLLSSMPFYTQISINHLTECSNGRMKADLELPCSRRI